MDTMKVSFPGGKRVDAEYGGHTIRTDQPPQGGGEGSAPPPFDLFLASIATCAGIYVKGYCDSRGISTEDLGLEMRIEREPEKHREGVVRAADLCAVKKHILAPPAFEIRTV